MGCFPKILKRSSDKRRATSSDSWLDFDEEETARAIALSIAEAEERGKNIIEDESELDEDEQIAQAMQESLNVNSSPGSPQNDYGSSLSPSPSLYPSEYRICAGCNNEIDSESLSFMGAVWHPKCFRCHSCNQPISEDKAVESDNHPYHKSCYIPKCHVCKNSIPRNADGFIDSSTLPVWPEKYCPSHETDGTPHCCSCERKEPVDARYLILEDERKLCLECLGSSIMGRHECEQLYLEIQEFYEGLNMKVEQQIPLLLVERQALNEAMEGEKKSHHHMPETRGLCLSEVQIVNAIWGRPRIEGHEIMDTFSEACRLVRECEVTAILVLYGLPRLLTGSILAHEMMHAWLRLKGCRTLSPKVEEGICQVLAHMWLDSEILACSATTNLASSSSSSSPSNSKLSSSEKGKRSEFKKKLGEFLIHKIQTDPSATYGDGFREGYDAVSKYDLERTLNHILLTGCFP